MEKYSIMDIETDLGLLFNSFSFNTEKEPWMTSCSDEFDLKKNKHKTK